MASTRRDQAILFLRGLVDFEGLLVLLVTHDQAMVEAIADNIVRVGKLRFGRNY